MELVIAIAPPKMGGKHAKGCDCGCEDNHMKKESIEFKAPEGMEVPEGINPGDTFEVMATVELGEGGELYLKEVDGMPVGEQDDMAEDKAEGGSEEAGMEGEDMSAEEDNAPTSQGGFLAAIERRATSKKKMA
jgi:hypothetical protein